MKEGKYSTKITENPNVTYFLGAGASYNSVPIWKEQGRSMKVMAAEILDKFETIYPAEPEKQLKVKSSGRLKEFFETMQDIGEKALEFGSIDIYAKRLYLLGHTEELNYLKFCLSTYLDLWENYYHKIYNDPNKKLGYSKIDKRYYSLFSVILEKGASSPKLNSNVKFITWNYDLQLESSYESFLHEGIHRLVDLNQKLRFSPFLNDLKTSDIELDIYHLNGHRGIFHFEDSIYESVIKKKGLDFWDYLVQLDKNFSDF